MCTISKVVFSINSESFACLLGMVIEEEIVNKGILAGISTDLIDKMYRIQLKQEIIFILLFLAQITLGASDTYSPIFTVLG